MSDSLSQALARINAIGSAITQLSSDGTSDFRAVLAQITRTAADLALPDEAHAVMFTYDAEQGAFEPGSRVAVEGALRLPQDYPRGDGMGSEAISTRQAILCAPDQAHQLPPAQLAAGAQAGACFPLVFGGEVMGVLYVYLHRARAFNANELMLYETLSHLAAMTVSIARQAQHAQQDQARKERELRRLRRAGMLISTRSSLTETLETILNVALEITDAIYGIFRLVDRSGKNLVTAAISGEGLERPAVETLPINENSIMGTVALRREPIIISDLRQSPWSAIYYPFDHDLEMHSELAVPLIGASGRLEGVLNLESPMVNAFDKQDRYIMQILATQAVVAIQEARLLDALQQASALLTAHTPERVLQALVERALDLLNVAGGLIWLEANGMLTLHAAHDPALRGLRIATEGRLVWRVMSEGLAPAALHEAGEISPPYPDLPGFSGRGSVLIVPLADAQNAAIGAFVVYTAPGDARDFLQSDWDKKVLSIFGQYAILALKSATQQEALRLAEEQRATTEAFAAIGDIAANLLHRLNNKIGTIPVRVEGIEDKCGSQLRDEPYLQKNLEEIARSAFEAMQVVRESLELLHPIQLGPVSVAASVREALLATRLPAGVQVDVYGLDSLPPVVAGSKRLSLVFSNLLENASDAMGGVGSIMIEGRMADERVEIRVSDTGPGILPELHERIFEFNYSARVSAHPGKLGFGLWWVKTLMARFGGMVTVESDGRRGTVFTLNLPPALEEA